MTGSTRTDKDVPMDANQIQIQNGAAKELKTIVCVFQFVGTVFKLAMKYVTQEL